MRMSRNKPIKRTTKIRRISKKPHKIAKDKAWKQFSQWVAYHGAIKTTGTLKQCRCYTCGKLFPSEGKGRIQAGHAMSGRNNSILFSEELVRPQCYGDNVWGAGKQDIFMAKLLEEHGDEKMCRLIREARTLKQFTVDELGEIEQHYRQQIEELKKEHGYGNGEQ